MKRYCLYDGFGHESFYRKIWCTRFPFIRNGSLSEHNNTGTWRKIWFTIYIWCIVYGIYKFLGFYCWVSTQRISTYIFLYPNVTIYTKYKNHPHVFGAKPSTTAEKKSNLTCTMYMYIVLLLLMLLLLFQLKCMYVPYTKNSVRKI